MRKGNWEESIYRKLCKLIDQQQNQQQYVVFDWDNTCIINDIGEAVFNYQLKELSFELNPEELAEVLVKGIPSDSFKTWNNLEGKALNVELLAADIVASYRLLYQASRREGERSVDVTGTAAYQEFITKMRFLYDAIGDSFSADVSYPWVTYFLAGKTAKEIHDLVEATLAEELTRSLSYETWESPEAYGSQSGQVSIRFKRGIRLIPEMQELMAELTEKGIRVYIVSASNREVILPFATSRKFGYGLATEDVYGMRLKQQGGRMLPELDDEFAQTQGVGKTLTIKELIASRHQNSGPIMVAGDSDGDVSMLSDFPDTELAIIIDRHKKGKIGELVEIGRSEDSEQRYFVQGRDEVTGAYLNKQVSRVLKF
ncbi:haloacid dehalogenase-like hydrolase [uncultured Vagococcus sp.]|uniref:haloacid dehalogenase-like hydrolase n=1 Tax=uncultured Vagococcus sp. TaxID=189676 RepID=UPI0028D53D4F|nr:haloacid dehalogenase-like hydrolase [uncultured Vagococcus sp.]